jgi:hypothetical protein
MTRRKFVNMVNKGLKCLLCERNARCKGYCMYHYLNHRRNKK